LQIVVKILAFVFLATGCAVVKEDINKMISGRGSESNLSLEEKVMLNNITNNGFFITKASINIEKEGVTINTVANIKFNGPQKYLISIRSFGGIEAARIFMTDDTLLINDRINKKLLYGKPEYLKRAYGIDPIIIPVIFGDFCSNRDKYFKSGDCINGKAQRTEILDKYRAIYTIDCAKEKIVSTAIESDGRSDIYNLSFYDFTSSGGIIFPRNINLEKGVEDIKITIEIKEIEYPWKGEFDFIPGIRYEKVKLL